MVGLAVVVVCCSGSRSSRHSGSRSSRSTATLLRWYPQRRGRERNHFVQIHTAFRCGQEDGLIFRQARRMIMVVLVMLVMVVVVITSIGTSLRMRGRIGTGCARTRLTVVGGRRRRRRRRLLLLLRLLRLLLMIQQRVAQMTTQIESRSRIG